MKIFSEYIACVIFQQNLKHTGKSDIVTTKAGDVNRDNKIDLGDIILCLQISCGMESAGVEYRQADVNGDNKIGLAELSYALQEVSRNK